MADNDKRHIENIVFGHNSTVDCPIITTFYLKMQNPRQNNGRMSTILFQTSKIKDGGRGPS